MSSSRTSAHACSADLEPAGDSFGERAQGGGRAGWSGDAGDPRHDGEHGSSPGHSGPFARSDRDTVRVSARASRAGALLLALTLLNHQGERIKGVSCPIASLTRRRALPAQERVVFARHSPRRARPVPRASLESGAV